MPFSGAIKELPEILFPKSNSLTVKFRIVPVGEETFAGRDVEPEKGDNLNATAFGAAGFISVMLLFVTGLATVTWDDKKRGLEKINIRTDNTVFMNFVLRFRITI